MAALAEFRALLAGKAFRRLVTVRLLSQLGDGCFQAGLAYMLFFDPTKATTAKDIAIGFAILLAPFTLVGPLVGPLIDRWQRTDIVRNGNLIRVVLTALLATLVSQGVPDWVIILGALITLSVNRFLLASMTAGLPRVVPADGLLTANAVLPTLGTVSAALGAGIGVFVTYLAPSLSDSGTAVAALAAAALAFGLSSFAATRMGRRELGPEFPYDAGHVREQFGDLVRGLASGARYLRRRRTPWHALGVMAAQRLLYGLMFVSAILLSRSVLSEADDAADGFTEFARVLLFAAIGFALAAILTPTLGRRFPRHAWIVMCLLIGAVGQGILAMGARPWTLLTAAVVVSFAVQGAKIAVDTVIQRDTQDEMRGRAFAFYDMAYNVAFVSAAAVAALILPDSGYSRTVMAGIAGAYVLVALVYARAPHEPSPAEVGTP